MNSNKKTWQPVIDTAAPGNFRYIQKLAEIAETVLENIPEFKSNSGIVSDRIGAVLFLFYYSRFTDNDRYAQAAYDLISLVFDEVCGDIENNRLNNGSNGLSGVGWTLEHLAQYDFLDIDTQDMLGDIDEFLYETMLRDMEEKKFDYMVGALQKGLYFLNRAKNPGNKTAGVYLSDLVNVMDRVVEKDNEGRLMFFTMVNDEDGKKHPICNLGLAHGMPSVAWFLGKLAENEINGKTARRLLDGFISYILKHTQDPGEHSAFFPQWVVGESSPGESRLAWCYGDLGLGTGIFQAAAGSKNKELEKQMVDVLIHSAGRRGLEANGVKDAGMCHGTAGLAHIFNRMYNYTGRGEFKDAALHWFGETLEMAAFEDGYAGYKRWNRKWYKEVDIFDGVTGIGLSLLAAVSGIEPAWDRMMLLS